MAQTPTRIRRIMPIRGLRTDLPPDAQEMLGYSPRCLNVRFRFGRVKEGPGRKLLAGPSDGTAVKHIGRFALVDGTKWGIKLTEDGLFRWGASVPGNPRQWHRVLGPVLGGNTRWGVTTGEDNIFFSRGDTTIYHWNGQTGTPYAAITPSAGTVYPCRFLEYFFDRVLAISTTEVTQEHTNRVRYTASGNYTDWGGPGAGFIDIYEGEEEPFQGARVLGGRCVLYRQHSIGELVPQGNASPVFGYTQRATGMGTRAGWTIASNGLQHFFLGVDNNVWVWDGSQLTPIGDPILPELESLLDPTLMSSYFGFVSTQRQEYWLVLTTGDAFVYDYLRQTWSRDSFGSLTALGEIEDTFNAEAWSTIASTWDTEGRTWAEMSGTQVTSLFAGRSDGGTFLVDDTVAYDYYTEGSIVDRYVETQDYFWPTNMVPEGDPTILGTLHRTFIIYDYENDIPFKIGFSQDRGRTWEEKEIVPVRSGFSYVDFRLTSNVIRWRFRETDANARFRWSSFAYQFLPAGEFNG